MIYLIQNSMELGPEAASQLATGQRMGGHQGDQRATLQNLEIVDIRPRQNLLLIKGAVPGGSRGLVLIREAKKKKKGKPAAG